jgi:hypothetical protein
MRGAPHSGFCSDIVRIRARASGATGGRPWRRRLFHVQNKRKPWRCQATTVSGFTITTALRQSPHARDSQPRATGPLSAGAAVEIGTAATPAVDAGVRGPRGAARHVTGSSLGGRQNGNQHRHHRDQSLPVTIGKFNMANRYGVLGRHRYRWLRRLGQEVRASGGGPGAGSPLLIAGLLLRPASLLCR